MNCCDKCFDDPVLVELIITNSIEEDNCDFCKSKSKLISCSFIAEHFQALFDLYTTHPTALNSLGIDSPVLLHTHLTLFWPSLFNSSILEDRLIKLLVDNIARESEDYGNNIFSQPVELHSFAGDPDTLHELELQWDSFANDIKFKNRFFLSKELDTNLLESIFERLIRTYPSGKKFYRARISDDHLPIEQMGKPNAQLVTGGRANPIGIPYLYLSNDWLTTMYETRISLHESLTIGEFENIESLNLVSLTNISQLGPFEVTARNFDLEEFITYRPYLKKLETELSKPVRKQDSNLDYLPTQFLCEFIKSMGLDAVEYKSAMHEGGSNIALFDDSKIKCLKTKFYKVASLEYASEEVK